MGTSLCRILFMAFCLTLTPALWAADAADQPLPRAELDRRVVKLLGDTINQGAAAFNGGNQEGCYRLYQGTLQTLVPFLGHRPELREMVAHKLRRAETLHGASAQAFLLREAVDEVRDTLHRGMRMPAARSLYERLGGEAAIQAVVDDFVARAAADPKVNFTRKGTPLEWQPTPDNVARLKKGLVELVGAVTGGPQQYEGRSMKAVHQGMAISDAEFDALAGDLKATLGKFRVPPKEQDELMQIVGSTRPDIVEKK